MTEEEYKKRKNRISYVFIGVAILAVILWLLSGYVIDKYSNSGTERGTFGDMFGAINALFSGLALGGVIYTILLQRLELELQRDEIRYSSEQLKGQKEILDRQNFEDKFFKLIEHLNREVSNFRFIEYIPLGKDVKPRKIEYIGYEALERYLFGVFTSKTSRPISEVGKDLNNHYHIYFTELNKYINQLEFIIRFIHNSELPKEAKSFYMDYFRRTLDEYGKLFLAFYGIAAEGQQLKNILEEYTFFSDLRLIYQTSNDNTWNIPPELGKYYPHLQEIFNKQKERTTMSHLLTFNFTV